MALLWIPSIIIARLARLQLGRIHCSYLPFALLLSSRTHHHNNNKYNQKDSCFFPISPLRQSSTICIGMATTTTNDGMMPSSSSLQQQSNVSPVVHYLEEILDNVKKSSSNSTNDDDVVALKITQKHVKTMIRCLLGLSKIEFTDQLHKFQIQQDWKDIQTFIEETHGPALLDLLEKSDRKEDDLKSKAPNLLDGLTNYQQLFDPTKTTFSKQKVFAYLSRGRTYQGKLERLLQEWLPDLLPSYKTQFMPDNDDLSNNSSSSTSKEYQQLLHAFVLSKVQELEEQKEQQETLDMNEVPEEEDNKKDGDDDSQTLSNIVLRQALLDCINIEFPPGSSSQPIDGVKAGKKSEMDLVTYLTQHQQASTSICNNNDNASEESTTTKTKDIRILAPVYIVQNRRKINNKRKCRYVLEILTSSSKNKSTTQSKNIGNKSNNSADDMFGMTTEWDAVVIQIIQNQNNTTTNTITNTAVARVLEVWESKASLHAGTIHDALVKKYNSITQLFGGSDDDDDDDDTNPLRLWIGDESFPVIGGVDKSILPRIGVFGANLWDPSQAAKHYQTTMLEEYFQRNPKIVVEYALKPGGGKIPASIAALGNYDYQKTFIKPLEKLIETARTIQPRLVVATTKEGGDEDYDDRMDKEIQSFE